MSEGWERVLFLHKLRRKLFVKQPCGSFAARARPGRFA